MRQTCPVPVAGGRGERIVVAVGVHCCSGRHACHASHHNQRTEVSHRVWPALAATRRSTADRVVLDLVCGPLLEPVLSGDRIEVVQEGLFRHGRLRRGVVRRGIV